MTEAASVAFSPLTNFYYKQSELHWNRINHMAQSHYKRGCGWEDKVGESSTVLHSRKKDDKDKSMTSSYRSCET